jgi:putative two-component system response regulator
MDNPRFTVLVVDDDPELLDTMTKLLELELGRCARVLAARDGARALALALAAPPDLIICDYTMPFMDGPALVRHARNQATLRHVPIIMVSAEPRLAELTRDLDVQERMSKLALMDLPTVARRFLSSCAQAAGGKRAAEG